MISRHTFELNMLLAVIFYLYLYFLFDVDSWSYTSNMMLSLIIHIFGVMN